MRKNELLQQNLSLFEQLQQEKIKNGKLNAELKAMREETERLNESVRVLQHRNAELRQSELLKADQKAPKPALSPQIEYGSAAIGKVVVSAADYANQLTRGGQNRYRELVNLILGRTEVAKSEILAVIGKQLSEEETKAAIDSCCDKAEEYFKLVMAQRDPEEV